MHRKEYCHTPLVWGPCQGSALRRKRERGGALRRLRCQIPFRCTTKKGTPKVVPFLVVHRKEFESLAFGSVDQRSIQLS